MNKNIETGKPVVNNTRRQLLIGAGLTPLVVTLHASKVSAQELVVSVSGAAPFSGVIQGSVGPDGTPGSEDTEITLYKALENNTELQAYYGNMGSEHSDAQSYAWEYGSASAGNGNPGNWTPEFEKRFWEPVEDYQTAVTAIQSAAKSIREAADAGVQATALATDPLTDSIKSAFEAVKPHVPTDLSVGVFKVVNEALANLPTRYENAKTAYRDAVSYFNTAIASATGDVPLEPVTSIF